MADRARADDDVWLVLRAQSGDRQAFDELLVVYEAPIARYVRGIIRDASSAEDVVQEIFLRVYRKLKWLREPELFRSWTYQIATREAFRHLGKESRWSDQEREPAILEQIVDQGAAPQASMETLGEIANLMSCLSPASRAVISLFYLHEMTIEETAAILEIPVGTAKSRLAYGLQTLRRQFEKESIK